MASLLKPLIKILDMDKIIQQKEFIRVLYEAKVSRKTAVQIVKLAFSKGVLQKKSTTLLDFDHLSRRIVSQYFYNFKREDSENIYFDEDCTAKALQSVTSVEAIVDVIDKTNKNITDEPNPTIEETVRQEDLPKTNEEAIYYDKIEKKSFWDL